MCEVWAVGVIALDGTKDGIQMEFLDGTRFH